jgi:hypothetical protein
MPRSIAGINSYLKDCSLGIALLVSDHIGAAHKHKDWKMMNGWMEGGGMWFGGVGMLLIGILVILSIAALIKYLMK